MPNGQYEEYIRWNQLTRHQLIIAHMTLIAGHSEAVKKLAKALGTSESYGLLQLADQAAAAIQELSDARIRSPI